MNEAVRCTCRRKPILAKLGTDGKRTYLEILSMRHREVHVRVIVTEGTLEIYCRDCGRWTKLNVKRPQDRTIKVDPPEVLSPVKV